MCGIIGCNFRIKDVEVFNITQHRGPDNTGFVNINDFTFAHNRLAIVDHDPKSNQPFTSKCGRYTIVFNGEIYNYQKLRSELTDKYDLITFSDTETLLYQYIEYGENVLHRLRGMFSFAIYDKLEKRLFCARDRLGIKPFVYYFKEGKFIFASEIKTILGLLKTKGDINTEAIYQYLHYLYIPSPNTIFKDIFKLPPGHMLVYQNDNIRIKEYWNVENFAKEPKELSEIEILKQLDHILSESISLRMIADVELGSFLSGGIDSSLILYYMQKHSSRKINTYTLGFKDAAKYDETSDAKLMAEYFNTNHTEIIIDPNAADLLPKMVSQFDEPFGNPTALLIHELTKETKKYATVALAGDGGDEIFGGYSRYEALLLYNKIKMIPKPLFRMLSKISDLLPEDSTGNHKMRRIRTFVKSLSKNESEMYDDWVSYFSDEELSELFKSYKPYTHTVAQLWEHQNYEDRLLKSSIVDLKTFLPNNLLYYGDIMSMANSFEVRFPLIDHKIIEFMTSLPTNIRIKEGKTKYIVKKLLEGKVPDRIINKPKLGLNPPMGIWLKKDLDHFIQDHLSRRCIKRRELFNPSYIEKIQEEHRTGKRDRSLYIWGLIVLEEWFRQYID